MRASWTASGRSIPSSRAISEMRMPGLSRARSVIVHGRLDSNGSTEAHAAAPTRTRAGAASRTGRSPRATRRARAPPSRARRRAGRGSRRRCGRLLGGRRPVGAAARAAVEREPPVGRPAVGEARFHVPSTRGRPRRPCRAPRGRRPLRMRTRQVGRLSTQVASPTGWRAARAGARFDGQAGAAVASHPPSRYRGRSRNHRAPGNRCAQKRSGVLRAAAHEVQEVHPVAVARGAVRVGQHAGVVHAVVAGAREALST